MVDSLVGFWNALDLRGVFAPAPRGHLAAITDPAAVDELLRRIDAYEGNFFVSRALRIAPLVFVRAGELVKAEWEEFDFKTAEWRIPPSNIFCFCGRLPAYLHKIFYTYMRW